MYPIGGGRSREIVVQIKEEPVKIQARLGLHGIGSLGVVLAPAQYAGMFVVRNEDIQGWQLVTSVYHAFRQTWHVLLKYGLDLTMGEKSIMARITDLFQDLNLRVLGLAPGTSLETYRNQVSVKAAEGARSVGYKARRESKQEVVRQLRKVAKGKDNTRRLNPSAAMARTVAGHEAAIERLESEIAAIDPHITKRQRALIFMIQLSERQIEGVERFVKSMLAYNGLKAIFDNRRRLVIAQHCEFWAQKLARMDFHPYVNPCEETAADLRLVRDLLRAGFPAKEDVLEVRKILRRCKSALLILHHLVAIERVIYQMTRAMEADTKPARSRWQRECLRIQYALKEVDESSFRHPVSEKASDHAFNACMFLSRGTATGKGDTRSARESLKKASAVLSGLDHPNQ